MQTGKTNDETTLKKGVLLGEFSRFSIHASDMSPEQKKLIEERFAKNKISAAVEEVLLHRDLQMRVVGEQIRFAQRNNFTPS